MSLIDGAIQTIQGVKADLLDAQNKCDEAIATLQSVPPSLVDCAKLAIPTAKTCRWATALAPFADGRTAIYFPKTSSGYPYDIKILDARGLREHSTENDKLAWTDPKAASSWKSYDAAVYFMPRFYDPSQGEITVSDIPDLPWTRWWTCTTHDPQSHLGAVRTTFSGPYADKNWGGDIGQSNYFVTHYYYKGNATAGFTVRENFYWSDVYGWFGWEAQDGSSLTNVWVTRPNYSIHNTVVTANPKPVDPCGIASKVFF